MKSLKILVYVLQPENYCLLIVLVDKQIICVLQQKTLSMLVMMVVISIFSNRVAPAKQRHPLNVNSNDVTDFTSFQESKTRQKNRQKSEEKVTSFAQNL